ncbi:hypothetical protein [Hasllibacter sp. MH4015]|uniref:hypothetical protein n=1 Tax=Hasllibacter sp. MH4015 TaxID=2854029 RepID=UPI001CD496C5|nr:hypothetical protein [Hasllibacter sp. MH4015]
MRLEKILIAALAALSTLAPTLAAADSCWWHNGSLMRLSANGEYRYFHYEQPRAGLEQLGIYRGQLLFSGTNRGGYYRGSANAFNGGCFNQPLSYAVEGPVGAGQTSITLYGTRQVRQGCNFTGQVTQDVLTFTYAYQC